MVSGSSSGLVNHTKLIVVVPLSKYKTAVIEIGLNWHSIQSLVGAYYEIYRMAINPVHKCRHDVGHFYCMYLLYYQYSLSHKHLIIKTMGLHKLW